MTAKKPGNKKEGARKKAPDLVRLVNDKKVGFIFITGGKIGPGESAEVLRTIARHIIGKSRAACHIEEITIEIPGGQIE